jgi:hypothetical protein
MDVSRPDSSPEVIEVALVLTDTSWVLADAGSSPPDHSLVMVSLDSMLIRGSSGISKFFWKSCEYLSLKRWEYFSSAVFNDFVWVRISRDLACKYLAELSCREYRRLVPSSAKSGKGGPAVNPLARNTSWDE